MGRRFGVNVVRRVKVTTYEPASWMIEQKLCPPIVLLHTGKIHVDLAMPTLHGKDQEQPVIEDKNGRPINISEESRGHSTIYGDRGATSQERLQMIQLLEDFVEVHGRGPTTIEVDHIPVIA